jgi:hypothetical protein
VFFFFVPARLPQQQPWKRQAMPVYGLIDPFLVACFLLCSLGLQRKKETENIPHTNGGEN